MLPKRANRGERMSALVGEALEADEAFWKQGAFEEEEEEDEDFDFESEGDSADSDIDLPEDKDSDEDTDKDAALQKQERDTQRRTSRRRAGVYAETKPSQRGNRKVAKDGVASRRAKLAELQKRIGAATSSPSRSRGQTPTKPRLAAQTTTRRSSSKRLSTDEEIRTETGRVRRQSTLEKSLEADQRIAEREKRESRQAPRKKPVFRVLSQEERLARAVRVAEENRASLAQLLMLQEEQKRVRSIPKPVLSGPRTIYRSFADLSVAESADPSIPGRCCSSTITFQGHVGPEVLNTHGKKRRPPRVTPCPVSGEPSRYRDPVTGIRYATLDAFRVIRSELEKTSDKLPIEERIRRVKANLGATSPQGRPLVSVCVSVMRLTIPRAGPESN